MPTRKTRANEKKKKILENSHYNGSAPSLKGALFVKQLNGETHR